MKYPYKLIIITVFLFLNNAARAQDDSTSKKSFVKFNVNYLTNAVYFARKDSSPVPYLRSSITYNHKSGFYVSAGTALLVSSNEPTRIDLIDLDGGYNFTIGKVDAGAYLSKFFYSKASYAVNSELKGMAGFYAGYSPGWVSIGVGGEMMFSTNSDLGANINLSHTFEHGEEGKNHWTFVPTLQANAGTQYFNEAYYEFRKFSFPTTAGNSGNGSGNSSGKGSGRGHSNGSNSGSGGGTGTTTAKTVTFYDRNRFTVLDIEFSVPINYETKTWGVYANPVVAFPINPATFAIDNAIQKEKLSTVFFAEIGAFIKLQGRH